MFIFKNAWISITRNKGRNILIGAVILVIAAACTVALAINNTANDLIASYVDSVEKTATIAFNREGMMKNVDMKDRTSIQDAAEKFNEIESYTADDIEKFGESEYISNYYYTFETSLNGSDIEATTMELPEDVPTNGGGGPNGFSGGEMKMDSAENLDFTVLGYSSLAAMNEFIEGTYTMNEIADGAWEKAFDGNYALINEELAAYNELAVNDKIVLADEDGGTYEFTILGIFAEDEAEAGGEMAGGAMPEMGNLGGTKSVQVYDSIDAVVDFGVLLELLGLGTLLVLVSSLVGMISIQRFSPLTILRERS